MNDTILQKAVSFIDRNFVEDILREKGDDAKVSVTHLQVEFATNKGDNFTSDMFRVYVEYEHCKKCQDKTSDKLQLIVKCAPLIEGPHKEWILNSTLFQTEIMMLSDSLEKMNNLLGYEYKLNARCFKVQLNDPMFLVLEDLKPLGFRVRERQLGLDVDHTVLAIQGLARFHASSVALCEKEPHLRKTYLQGVFMPTANEHTKAFFSAAVKKLAAEIAKWEELDSSYADKVSKLSDNIFERCVKASKLEVEEYNVINHGDYWSNNMMFKYDDQGTPVQHVCVDFQICNYASPALDLQKLLNTSVRDDVLVEHENFFIREYHQCLVTTMKRIKCQTQPPSPEDLKAALTKAAVVGMMETFVALPMVMANKTESQKLNDLLTEDGTFNNPGYSNAGFRKTLVRRLQLYETLGLLN